MFDSLSDKLEGALRSLSGQGRITELNIAESMREIRRALLDADVNYQVAREFTERIKEKALGQDVLSSVSPGQQLVKIVYDELVYFLGNPRGDFLLSPASNGDSDCGSSRIRENHVLWQTCQLLQREGPFSHARGC